MSECPDCSTASGVHATTVDLLFNLTAAALPYVVCVAAVMFMLKFGVMCGKESGKGSGGGAAASIHTQLVKAGLWLGIGLGGFLNDIVLRQILQCHQILSSRLPPGTLEAANCNLLWAGVAGLFNLAMTVTGLALLFRAARHCVALSGRALVGAMLSGWGLFIVVEGLLDHQLLEAHHMPSDLDHLVWDLAYLLFGAVLMMIGSAVVRSCGHASWKSTPQR